MRKSDQIILAAGIFTLAVVLVVMYADHVKSQQTEKDQDNGNDDCPDC